jgi:integrase
MDARVKPWWRSNRGWYATVNGKQIPLGVTAQHDESAAWAAVHDLIRTGQIKIHVPPAEEPAPASSTIGEAIDAWLTRQRGNPDLKPKTLSTYVRHAEQLRKRTSADATVRTLTADRLEDASRVPTWSKSTRRGFLDTAIAILKAAGWTPDRKIKKPRKESAGVAKVITEAAHWQIVGRARGDFREFVRCLWELGCRPSELAGLTAEKVDWAGGVAVLKDHKNENSTGRPRTLYFSAAAMAILRRQRERYPSGLLFRSTGGLFMYDQLIVKRFHTIARSLRIEVSAYSYRHTFITRALQSGITAAQVAELVGTSVGMISRNYGHLESKPSVMREVLSRIA